MATLEQMSFGEVINSSYENASWLLKHWRWLNASLKDPCQDCLVTSPGPSGCRNQVLPRPSGLLEGWVGWTARLVFTSPLLSSTVGIATTGMSVHCSSVPLEDRTSVYPSSQLHVLVCGRARRSLLSVQASLGPNRPGSKRRLWWNTSDEIWEFATCNFCVHYIEKRIHFLYHTQAYPNSRIKCIRNDLYW